MNRPLEFLVPDTTQLPSSEEIAPPCATHQLPPSTEHLPTNRRDCYLSVNSKFRIAVAGGLAWMLLSILLTLPWLRELRASSGPIAVLVAIAGIAIIPGFMNAFLLIRLSQSNCTARDCTPSDVD